QATFRAVADGEQRVLALDGAARCGGVHGKPEDEAVVGRFGQCRPEIAAAVEQAGFVGPPEARPPGQRRVAERCAQQVVQAFAAVGPGRLGRVEQGFENRLLFQRIDVSQGGDVLLAFDQAVQQALDRADAVLAPAFAPQPAVFGSGPPRAGAVAVRHQILPRIASTKRSTVTSPWMVAICSAGTPPVTRFGVCMKCRIHSTSPPVSAERARARRTSSKASSPCLEAGSSDCAVFMRLTAVRCMPRTSASRAWRRPSWSAARRTALASTASGEGTVFGRAVMAVSIGCSICTYYGLFVHYEQAWSRDLRPAGGRWPCAQSRKFWNCSGRSTSVLRSRAMTC